MKSEKKMILMLFVSCYIFTIKAQDYVFKVRDSSSNEPLVFASVFCPQANTGTGTDLMGIAKLDLSDSVDSVIITYIGYERKIVLTKHSEDTIIVNMSSSIHDLKTVDITAEKINYDAKSIIKESIKRIKDNYVNEVSSFDAVYEEIVFADSNVVSKMISEITVSYQGYPSRKYVKDGFKNYYRNNFEKPYPMIDTTGRWLPFENPFFFKYYSNVNDEIGVHSLEIDEVENAINQKYRYSTNGGPLALLAMDKVKFQSDILDSKLLNKYDYSLHEIVQDESGLLFIVAFRPKFSIFKSQTWDKKIINPILSGKIFIRKDTYEVEKIICQLVNDPQLAGLKFTEPWQIFPSETSLEISYKKIDGRLLVSRIKTVQTIIANTSIKWKVDDNLRLERELIRTDKVTSPKSKMYRYEDVFGANFRDIKPFLSD